MESMPGSSYSNDDPLISFFKYLDWSRDRCGIPSKKCDALRGLHLFNSVGTNDYCFDDENTVLKERCLKDYENFVDRMDELGMNNFAEGALALCKFQKNESKLWSSAITEDDILKFCEDETLLSDEEPNSDDPMVTIHGSNNFSKSVNENKDSLSSTKPLFKPDYTQSSRKDIACFPNEERISNSSKAFQNAKPNHQSPCNQAPSSNGNFCDQSDEIIWPLLGRHDHDVGSSNLQGHVTAQKSPHYQNFAQTYKHDRYQNESRPSAPPASHNQIQPVFSGLFQNPSSSGNHENVRERVEIHSESVGGPYANFGQKRKNPAFKGYQKGSRSWSKPHNEDDSDDNIDGMKVPFRTAREQFIINQANKTGGSASLSNYGTGKKSLGTRRGPAGKFVPPILGRDSDGEGERRNTRSLGRDGCADDEVLDERLKGIDPKMIELINNEIMDTTADITWEDIAGLDFAKKTIKEIVVWPMLRPDIFTGLRGPPKGLLLFGPPGTGKTLIGKCIASQSKSTFFCISASSLTSKWVGEGEKMVRALFAVARVQQPSVVFIDEIDSLMSQRSESEHESSRRIKTEFLVQLDGAATGSDDRILVIGATNRPQEIDEAARRRFVKRLLIPLPESVARKQIIVNLMSQQRSDLSSKDVDTICEKTDGYSGADMTNLCREAALGPIRSIPFEEMETVTADQVRPIVLDDFVAALHQVRASVSCKDLQLYAEWNQSYGSFAHGS